jgi:LDH2 family malate/lactate/ureidoglycolate dehydrogenase
MRDFAAIIHDTPPADPASPVLLPGEIELGRLERHRRDGIVIDEALVAKLEALATRSGA